MIAVLKFYTSNVYTCMREINGVTEMCACLYSEMPGLMLLRRKTCASTGDKPLKGARIVGCTHVTAQVHCVLSGNDVDSRIPIQRV